MKEKLDPFGRKFKRELDPENKLFGIKVMDGIP